MSDAYTFTDYVKISQHLLQQIHADAVTDAATAVHDAFVAGRSIYACGNGGSAANAAHFAEDLAKLMWNPQIGRRLRAQALTESTPLITALANDDGYARIFEIQLSMQANAGDVLFCISGSGNSSNVIRAARWARQQKLHVIGLTGYTGGELASLCQTHIHLPSDNMGLLECVHMMVLDYVSKDIRHRAYGTPHAMR